MPEPGNRRKALGIILVAAAAWFAPAVHATDMFWEAFTVADLRQEHAAQGRDYLRFLDRPSMSAGLYVLEAGAADQQSPHQQDEIYWILEHTAVLEVGEDEVPVEAGSIVYVSAHESHRFVDITEDLTVLVVFSKGPTAVEGPPWLATDLTALRRHARPNENRADEDDWHPFVDVPSMQLGLYLLPEALGGDETLVHDVDEINLVVSGSASFTVGEETIDVGPGSVLFVERGVGHRFSQLQGDFEVLILFAKSN